MIRVSPPDEPPGFDGEVRRKGRDWLYHPSSGERRRAGDRPRSFWTEWKECPRALAKGFGYRCGYTASYTPVTSGNVDHFVSWAECRAKEPPQHELAYEWSNFRWLDARLNTTIKSKVDRAHGSKLLLDPFEAKDEWFAVDPMSLTLEITDAVPEDKRALVEQTVALLQLREGPLVMAQRYRAMRAFCRGLSLEHIEEEDPLVARALRELFDTPDAKLEPAYLELKRILLAENRAARAKDPAHREPPP